jgi:hypothetical protein
MTGGEWLAVTVPIRVALSDTGWRRITANAASACDSGTMATNRPSFATYRGSNPNNSQAPRTDSSTGTADSLIAMPYSLPWSGKAEGPAGTDHKQVIVTGRALPHQHVL